MSRFLTNGYVRIVANSILASLRYSYPQARSYGTIITTRPQHLPQYRFYLHYSCLNRKHASHSLYNTTNSFCRSSISRNFSSFSECSTVTHHAQTAWKRISQRCSSHNGITSLNRIAQAFSLAISRFHLVVPGIFASTCGQLAWAQRSPGSTDYYPSANAVYAHAQDGHAFLASIMWSLLEDVILLLRALYLAVLFTPSIVMAPLADLFGPDFRKVWLQVVHCTLERAGPAFIQWGQWAATRPDLFPRDLCIQLAELQSKAPEHSFAYMKKTIEKSFGCKLSEIFDDF